MNKEEIIKQLYESYYSETEAILDVTLINGNNIKVKKIEFMNEKIINVKRKSGEDQFIWVNEIEKIVEESILTEN